MYLCHRQNMPVSGTAAASIIFCILLCTHKHRWCTDGFTCHAAASRCCSLQHQQNVIAWLGCAQELRRGSESATIYSIALSRACEWLAVSSDKGTVHVFGLSDSVRTQADGVPPSDPDSQQGPSSRQNPTSRLSLVNMVKVCKLCWVTSSVVCSNFDVYHSFRTVSQAL